MLVLEESSLNARILDQPYLLPSVREWILSSRLTLYRGPHLSILPIRLFFSTFIAEGKVVVVLR